MVTWSQEEIQAIDEDDFEPTVVRVIEEFFDKVDEPRGVAVEWKTPTRNHGSVYEVYQQPLVHLDRSRCFINIVGEQRGGKYQIDLNPSSFTIKTLSNGHTEELTFLRLRPEGVVIDPVEQERFLKNIPDAIKKKLISTVRHS
jgi:hypothetical protein